MPCLSPFIRSVIDAMFVSLLKSPLKKISFTNFPIAHSLGILDKQTFKILQNRIIMVDDRANLTQDTAASIIKKPIASRGLIN
jgi:hypothetical protein